MPFLKTTVCRKEVSDGVTTTKKADSGYEIESIIVKDQTNNKNLYRVVDLDSPTSHKISFKVYGNRLPCIPQDIL